MHEIVDHDCSRCKLHLNRKNIVIGKWNEKAPVMVIGEAPGQFEDESGLPFVGRAGQLLDKMLESIGLNKQNTYIANIIKCRPPENRNPDLDEIRACGDYLEAQIKKVNPKFIITTGAFSTSWLLNKEFTDKVKITQYVGKLYKYEKTPFMPIFHPAYLLRNEEKKQDTWLHLKAIFNHLDELGIYSD